ncbi:sel1 repeat family protein [Moraxellaceae bacterium AER2_44_116]|nr:sel1 repeat family protein [Moraxellaceae bacterium]TQC96167.1 sel1 repeat family protein [Moraxellaceae bacterium AER2_44_116]
MRWAFFYILSLVVMPVLADFDEGIVAYQKGDYVSALREFNSSARLGNVAAQYNLGFMYAKGRGVEKNYSEAFFWFLRAAKNGDSESQYHLAGMYENGLGVAQDYYQAAKWYRKAAEQGEAHAQLTLGGLYGIGLGAPQSYKQAYAWFNLAAIQGNESAEQGREVAIDAIPPQQIADAQALSAIIAKKYLKRQ